MPKNNIVEYSKYSPTQLYNLVMDIEDYPNFIPWCKAARILTKREQYMEAELMISFKHIRESYASKIEHNPESYRINVEMLRGPFHHLRNMWWFEPHQDGGCTIHFEIDFAFKNIFLEKIIGGLFNKATQKMVSAFKARADELYLNGV